MAAIPGTVVGSKIVPTDTADTYPTHEAGYGRGGWRTVADTAARDAIPAGLRQEGMIVYCQSDSSEYQLSADLATWTSYTGTQYWSRTGTEVTPATPTDSVNTQSRFDLSGYTGLYRDSSLGVPAISSYRFGDTYQQMVGETGTGYAHTYKIRLGDKDFLSMMVAANELYEQIDAAGHLRISAAGGITCEEFLGVTGGELVNTYGMSGESNAVKTMWYNNSSRYGHVRYATGQMKMGIMHDTPNLNAIAVNESYTNIAEYSQFFRDGGISVGTTGAVANPIGYLDASSLKGYTGLFTTLRSPTIAATTMSTSSISGTTGLFDYMGTWGTFTIGLTGIASDVTPTATAKYLKLGRQVTLYIPNLNGTSNSNEAALYGIPSGIQPVNQSAGNPQFCIKIRDDSVYRLGMVFIGASNVWPLYKDTIESGSNTWGISGYKGTTATTITYLLD
jgi:hypothetical protein